MSRTLAVAFSVALFGTALPARADLPAPGFCPGLTAELIEQQVSAEVRRFAFEGSMLKPFLELWSAGRRPVLPTPPERVTVW
ncbi:MAG: hypothetical protein R3349_05935, partial [Geminicoccaceae bacterium]|nr:hypothetical protein [Geminicoccaceae bacterium]